MVISKWTVYRRVVRERAYGVFQTHHNRIYRHRSRAHKCSHSLLPDPCKQQYGHHHTHW